LAVNDNDTKPRAAREGLNLTKRLIRWAIAEPGVPVDEPATPVLVYASPLELAKLDELRLIVDGALDEMFRRAAGESFDVPAVCVREAVANLYETDGAA
jgi:hypothetical protein